MSITHNFYAVSAKMITRSTKKFGPSITGIQETATEPKDSSVTTKVENVLVQSISYLHCLLPYNRLHLGSHIIFLIKNSIVGIVTLLGVGWPKNRGSILDIREEFFSKPSRPAVIDRVAHIKNYIKRRSNSNGKIRQYMKLRWQRQIKNRSGRNDEFLKSLTLWM